MKLIEKVIQPTGATHSATVIFFHGSGDTGNNLIEWIKFLMGRNIEIPHVKFIYPTAPVQKYTPLGGEYSSVWFDRKSVTPEAHEDRKSLAGVYETVNEMLKREIDGNGIPPQRVVVGGFSMGGCLAMHTGYHLNQKLGGVFALSAFLNNNSVVYETLDALKLEELPKLKTFHGDRDSLVPEAWGRKSFEELQKRGVHGNFTSIKNTLHELKRSELLELEKWLHEVLPPLESDLQNKL